MARTSRSSSGRRSGPGRRRRRPGSGGSPSRREDHAPEERDEEAHFGPAVEAGVAREGPGHPAHVERAQEGVGVVVGPDEDREVAIGPAAPRALPGSARPPGRTRSRRVSKARCSRRLAEALAPSGPLAISRLSIFCATSSRSGLLCWMSRYAASRTACGRAAVLLQHDLAARRDTSDRSRGCCSWTRRGSGRSPGRRRPPPPRCGSGRRAASPARTARSWCPGTRRPGCTGTGPGSARRTCGRVRKSRSDSTIWSPKSICPSRAIRVWYCA